MFQSIDENKYLSVLVSSHGLNLPEDPNVTKGEPTMVLGCTKHQRQADEECPFIQHKF